MGLFVTQPKLGLWEISIREKWQFLDDESFNRCADYLKVLRVPYSVSFSASDICFIDIRTEILKVNDFSTMLSVFGKLSEFKAHHSMYDGLTGKEVQ